MSRIFEKVYVLFRMNILIFVLLAVTVIALFAYQNGLDVIEPLYLSDYPYLIREEDEQDWEANHEGFGVISREGFP